MIDPISIAVFLGAAALVKASWSLVDQIHGYTIVGRKGSHYTVRVELKNDKFIDLEIEGDIDDLSPEKLAEFLADLDINTAESLEKISKSKEKIAE